MINRKKFISEALEIKRKAFQKVMAEPKRNPVEAIGKKYEEWIYPEDYMKAVELVGREAVEKFVFEKEYRELKRLEEENG